MIPFLTLLLGAALGVIGGYFFGAGAAFARSADEKETLKQRAEAAEKALETHTRTTGAQVKHAFDTAAIIVAECRNSLKTSQAAMADAVDLTKKAAHMILPQEYQDEELTASSVTESDRRVAIQRRLDRGLEERRRNE